MVECINRTLYKLTVLTLKYIPITLALGYALYTILGFFGIYWDWMGNIIHLSFIPWVFIYLVSFVLKFCVWHRIPLYYVIICDTLTLFDVAIGIPVSDSFLFLIHSILILLLLIAIVIYNVKNYKKSIRTDNTKYRRRKL